MKIFFEIVKGLHEFHNGKIKSEIKFCTITMTMKN